MANFVHLLIGVISALTFISFINANSLPTDAVPTLNASIAKSIEVNNHPGCSTDHDCSGHGTCLNYTVCHCNRGWTTHGNVAEPNTYCNYEQRSKKTAFFLSFIVGAFGVDWFYLSRATLIYIIAGVLKLLLAFGCFGSWPLTYFGPEIQNSESIKTKIRGVSTFFSLLAFAWWIVDWVRILVNKFPDGNGARLIPW
jgi:hypothetical protein